MKICYLANAASIHTKRWARHFAGRRHQITVISYQPGKIEGIQVYTLPSTFFGTPVDYFLNLKRVRYLVQKISPDILHAHYVTSYGLFGALAGKRPLIISAWGSDVLVAPEKSWLLRQIVRFSLSRANLVTSVAEHMTQIIIDRRL